MNYRNVIPKLIRALAAASLAVCILAAAEHHGSVKFAGLPVPGATVTLTQGDKKMMAVTDLDGMYKFADIPDGVWNLDIEMLGFQPLKQEVAIAPGAPSPQWELKMKSLDEIKAGATADTSMAMKVSTAPTPTTPVSSVTAPTPTPSIAGAAETASNTKNSKNSKNSKNGKNQPASAAPAGGFQRTDVNASAGAANVANDATPPSMAGVAEAQTSSDALVVNGSQSSGIERRVLGNNRKGPASLYRFGINTGADNSYLDAKTYSITGQNLYKPAQSRINAAADVGGPLYIPHLLRSNGQFFLSYQLVRNRIANTETATMPTAQELAGNFTQAVNAQGQPATILDPTTGQPFPNATIPVNRISPQAQALLKYYPLPNTTGVYNFQSVVTGRTDSDTVQTRLNRTLNQKNFVNGGFTYTNGSRNDNSSFNPFGFIDSTAGTGVNTFVNYRHVFSPRLNMNGTVSYNRGNNFSYPYFSNLTNVSGLAGITGNNQEPINWGPPGIIFNGGSGIQGLSDINASNTRQQQIALTGQGLWVRRPHNISFQADFRHIQANTYSQSNPRGTLSFNGGAAGFDFADFLLGIPTNANLAYGNADKYLRFNMYDASIGDDWRVGPSLSVNYGVRWEYWAPMTEKYGRAVNLDVLGFYSNVAAVTGDNPVGPLTHQSYPNSLIKPYKHAFQPRVSIAWRPIFGDSMVVRSGYSIGYDTNIYQGLIGNMLQQPPFSRSLNAVNNLANPFTLANAFSLTTPSLSSNTYGVDPDYRPGYAQVWNLSVQRDLPGGMILNFTYTGIKGTHNQQDFYPNSYAPGGTPICPSCPAGYKYLVSNGNSTRNTEQIVIRRRLHNGLTASATYTYGHAIDDAAQLGGSGGGGRVAQDWLNLDGERGRSSFDQRHNVQLQFQYTSGMGLKGGTLLSGWRGVALKGWTLLTNINMGTGLPLTPTCGACLLAGTNVSGALRASYFGGDIYAAPSGYFLNADSYGAPLPGTYGTAGRNSITGPNQFGLGGSAQRSFGQLNLRIDAANALNHVTFGGWQTNISSIQFGLPNTNANPMRSVSLHLSMRF